MITSGLSNTMSIIKAVGLTYSIFFADKTEDFIPAQINEYSTDFWHARQYDFKENIPLEKFLISFNPIMRLSKRALNVLDKSYRSGSSGFYEIFLATLFNSLDGLS